MGSNSNQKDLRDETIKGDYLKSRSTGRDDRQSDSKLDADARLRGSIGSRDANEIIKSIDNLKSRGLL